MKKKTPKSPYTKEQQDKLDQINLSLYRLGTGNQNMTVEEMKELMKKQNNTIEVTFFQRVAGTSPAKVTKRLTEM